MKWLIGLLQIMLFGVIVCLASSTAKSIEGNYGSNSLVNRIEGTVWNPERQPVTNVYVELQNEFLSTLRRVQTSSSGRFSFIGMPAARYTIKVLPAATNYLEYAENVDLVTYTDKNTGRSSSDTVYLDIYLTYDKRKINFGTSGITEAVFVQEVPEEARKLYNRGVKNIDSKDVNKGFAEIEAALKIFPDYYDALNMLGRSYTQRKEYQKALPFLIKSIDINQRSFSSFYALAYACYQLKHIPEAIEASRGATILQPNSLNAQLLYGTVLRIGGNHEKAMQALLQAKKLSKNSPISEVHWQLALLYNRTGKNKEAVDELEAYLKILPDAPNAKEVRQLIDKLRSGIKNS